MLRKIHLYGHLREEFGENYTFDVGSVAEAMRAFKSQVPGFIDSIREGEYAVVRGDDLDGEQLNYEMCKINYGRGDFHIVPAVEGSGSGKGWFAIIAGVALIALSFFVPAGGLFGAGILTAQTLGLLGAGLVLMGIASMLAPTPDAPKEMERADERPSFIFTGATNRVEQGGPLCLIYGETFVGSNLVAASYETEDIA